MGNTILACSLLVGMVLTVVGLWLGLIFGASSMLLRITLAPITCVVGAFAIQRVMRAAFYGVLTDDRGVHVLSEIGLFGHILDMPWSRIESFSIAYPTAVGIRDPSYGQMMLRDGSSIRLTTITAAMVGKRTRHRVETIVNALNDELADYRARP